MAEHGENTTAERLVPRSQELPRAANEKNKVTMKDPVPMASLNPGCIIIQHANSLTDHVDDLAPMPGSVTKYSLQTSDIHWQMA